MLDNVKHVILVMSGKGGVGKSTISSQLALAFKDYNYKVGLLDIDLCGPNIPAMTGTENADVHQAESGWVPIYKDMEKRFAIMSIGYLLKKQDDAIVWRGPKKTAMIRQFLQDVQWDDIDYLFIDTPPGTSDEHITVMECMKDVKCDGAILVTTPQEVALEDVRKEITFCRKTDINILGIIENMSKFVCPTCKDCSTIFSSGGGILIAEFAKIPYLGTFPIDSRIEPLAKEGRSIVSEIPDSTTASVLRHIIEQLTGIRVKPIVVLNDKNAVAGKTDVKTGKEKNDSTTKSLKLDVTKKSIEKEKSKLTTKSTGKDKVEGEVKTKKEKEKLKPDDKQVNSEASGSSVIPQKPADNDVATSSEKPISKIGDDTNIATNVDDHQMADDSLKPQINKSEPESIIVDHSLEHESKHIDKESIAEHKLEIQEQTVDAEMASYNELNKGSANKNSADTGEIGTKNS